MTGELKGKKIDKMAKQELIEMLDSLKALTVSEACKVLRLNERRYYRWRNKPSVICKKPAWNKITPREENAIVTAARDEALCDLRSADLMVYGHESGKFFCSVSTVQRILVRNKLQKPYEVPRRRRPAKPDIRALMSEPRKIFSYDATEFYLTNRLRVVVIPILDMGSRKFIHYGVRVVSFRQTDVMKIWDEALWNEGIDASQLTALSDRGSQMKGGRTKAHLIGKWNIRLEFARPYTPDDNAWIEAFIKYMKYHPECPEFFETVADVADWVEKFQKLYNDHPHSSLGYVRPNDEHAGLGNIIREKRRNNLAAARKTRWEYYHAKKSGTTRHAPEEERGSEGVLEACFETELGKIIENAEKVKSEAAVSVVRKDVFRANSSEILCQNR